LVPEQHSDRHLPGRPWQPGQSGNPAGRPKSLKALFNEVISDQELIALAVRLARGLPGKDTRGRGYRRRPKEAVQLDAIKFIGDRLWGKVPVMDEDGIERPDVIVIQLKPGQDF